MTEEAALREARHWVDVRKEVRAALIAKARELNPIEAPKEQYASAFPSNDVRKLWHYPSDLSEERLLALIDNPPTGGTDAQ